MQWSCEVRRVSLDNVNAWHTTNPAHRSRTSGPIDVTGSWVWGYRIEDGHHRVADARRKGRGSIMARVWRKVW